jgi:adenylate cyclase
MPMTPEMMQKRQNSPLHIAYFDGKGSRCRIGPEAEEGEFSILSDLRAAGMTDYLALPAPFSDGSNKAMTFATRAPGGFSGENIALLEAMMPSAAMILEIQTLRRTALTLLDTYVGPAAGRRVVEGSIKRGMGETIHSVIWFCDLRGFTELSSRLGDNALLALLNDYFGVMTDAVQSHGGEVLKFIGDAMLAIFALDGGADRAETAARALAAAAAARAALAEVNERRACEDAAAIRCGIALHVGDVHYGNIGGEGRLDFTVIGPAVNLASRIEALCAELGEDLLLSADFVFESGHPCRELGSFALKGIAARQKVYVPNQT